ncbi:glucosaminidase domain-containing protein [Psychroflexus sp. MES1-P1E]|uniref:glucosaminidase domain-containing protein n=1 Tax=Psychroflexus sp. MES1-P1E TaxID=2058320 RepID=UPI000C7A2305|nr:glucosaminidase domain-containing protein [Psychroflexus sp. MES1-P1E]PKG41132.1 N-acetylmuramidase [Psychroflexus sp. MES1-P1E]
MKLKASLYILLVIFISSCGSSKKSVATTSTKTKASREVPRTYPRSKDEDNVVSEAGINLASLSPVELYIYNYANIAKEEMRLYGIPASIKIAQGILESGSGNGPLTSRSNNHFGIKCNGWKGEKVYHDDDEAQECFRKYNDPKYSFRDHSLFLFKRNRYAFLFDYKSDDYTSWARGLKRAGYATDPRYPQKLISLIERYNLNEFDKEVLGKNANMPLPKPKRISNSDLEFYLVKKGDTLYNISQKFDITVEKLKLINKLKNDQIQIGQELKVKTR